MKIILVFYNENGKNVLFILDDLQVLTLAEAIKWARKGEITGVHVVESKRGGYIGSNPNAVKEDNLDNISIPLAAITRSNQQETYSVVKKYCQEKEKFLKGQEGQGEKVIYIDGRAYSTEKKAADYILGHKKNICTAAKGLKVDKNLLGAILIDECLRKSWTDDWFDWLAMLGRDTSVGIAQVKVSTARDLIRRGFYPADPGDRNISPKKIDRVSNSYLYDYLNSPKHSIYFAAAKINQIKHDFSSSYNVNKLEIIADLYSRKDLSSTAGRVTSRGIQIARQFYKIAQITLK